MPEEVVQESQPVSLYSTGFKLLWAAYPRRQKKLDAFKAYCQMEAFLPPLEDLIEVVEKQAVSEQWQKEGGQFIPLLASWIRGMRWEDEMEVVLPKPKDPGSNIPSWMPRAKDR